MSLYDTYLQETSGSGVTATPNQKTSLYDQYLASQKTSVEPATTSTEPGFWSKVGKTIASPFVGAFEGAKQVIDNKPEKSINPMAQVNAFTDSFSNTIKDSGDRLNKLYETAFDPNATDAEVGANLAGAGIGLVNSLFAPITATLSSAQANPLFGDVATGVNAIFGAMSGALAKPATDAVDNAVKTGAITQQTADAIRGPVEEVAGFVGVILGGAKATELLKPMKAKTQEITTALSEDANIKSLDSRAQAPLFDKYQTEQAAKASKLTVDVPKPEDVRAATELNKYVSGADAGKTLSPETITRINGIGVAELPVDKNGMITLYRDASTPPVPGTIQGYSRTKMEGQVPYMMSKDAIIADLSNSEITKLYSTLPEGLARNTALEQQARLTKLESEVLVRTPAEVGAKVNQVADVKANDILAQTQKVEPTTADTQMKSFVWERLKAENPQLEGSVGYDTIKLKEDAARAVDLIAKDKQEAYDVAMGKTVSSEVTQTAVNIALSEKALKEGNTQLYADLIRKRSLDQTRRGQEIVSERGSITDNSTATYVKELIASKLDALGGKYLEGLKGKRSSPKGKAVEKIESDVTALEKQIKAKKLDTKTALKLLDQLTCV